MLTPSMGTLHEIDRLLEEVTTQHSLNLYQTWKKLF